MCADHSRRECTLVDVADDEWPRHMQDLGDLLGRDLGINRDNVTARPAAISLSMAFNSAVAASGSSSVVRFLPASTISILSD
jgi:hypothetical protein